MTAFAVSLRGRRGLRTLILWFGWAVVGVLAYSALVLIYGKSPLHAFHEIWSSTLTTRYGLESVVVRMTPLLFGALAAAIPARIGLVNVGGEGQMFIGALAGTWVALSFTHWSASVLMPVALLTAAAAGGLWAAVAGWLRARGWLNEVFSTLLTNYIAILIVSALVFGPWRDPASSNYPQSRELPGAAQLPHLGSTPIDVTIFVALAAIVTLDWFLRRTRFGLEMRAIGSNPIAAAFNGIPVSRYIVAAMFAGGALAGFGGMGQVSAVQLHLNPALSASFGYLGFLISWLAGHNPRLIVPMTFLLAVLASSGDILQITQGLPFATVDVISAILMLIVLLARAQRRTA